MIVLDRSHASYPPALRDLSEPPDPIWVAGDASLLHRRSRVTIVGTRRMSSYGERVARELAAACARAGIVVISGLAQGIDSAAHRGALDAQGATVAVLGEGISGALASMPAARQPLMRRIRDHGALLSQFEPLSFAQKWTFVTRNATMAALGQVIVVVEAGVVSGALITAHEASRLGRVVYAVPGPLGSAASVGTNKLISSDRARALTGSVQLLAEFGASEICEKQERDTVLEALAAGPLSLDELRRAAGERSSAEIARLMLQKKVELTPDGRLRRA